MKLPNFICIGAQKSATTLLAEILRQHPDIFIPPDRAPHFFNLDENYSRGMEWYHSTFYRDADGFDFVGDITPAYMFFDYVPERIRNTLGKDIKIIVMLRNPINRAYSHYWMSFKREYERLPFDQAIMMEHARMKKGYFEQSHFSYISRGFYSVQIKRYLNFFSAGNMKFVLFEEFVKDIPRQAAQILEFLGCDKDRLLKKRYTKVNKGDLTFSQYLSAVRTNKSGILSRHVLKALTTALSEDRRIGYPPLSRKMRVFLSELYKDEISELEALIGKDLSLWRRRV